jgi:hypothetical protein
MKEIRGALCHYLLGRHKGMSTALPGCAEENPVGHSYPISRSREGKHPRRLTFVAPAAAVKPIPRGVVPVIGASRRLRHVSYHLEHVRLTINTRRF